MGGGAACLEQRPLLDHHDVAPSEIRQVIGDAASRYARADDDRSCSLRQCDIRHIG